MTDNKPRILDDPRNRIVCVFEDTVSAEKARAALVDYGFAPNQVRLLRENDAKEMDTSAKWFADTDEEMKKFERQLRGGLVAVALPVRDAESRQQIYEILQSHGAHRVTHFGEWVTEVMR